MKPPSGLEIRLAASVLQRLYRPANRFAPATLWLTLDGPRGEQQQLQLPFNAWAFNLLGHSVQQAFEQKQQVNRYSSAFPVLTTTEHTVTERQRKAQSVKDVASSQILAQWHPTKNGSLLPEHVAARSFRRVWWRCDASACPHAHDWQAAVYQRVVGGTRCPFCTGRKVCPCGSLAALHPDIAAQWHPALNGDLQPQDVGPASKLKVHWRCRGSPCQHPHDWRAAVSDRVAKAAGCPFCFGLARCPCDIPVPRATGHRLGSLAALRPDLASQWHPTLNGGLAPAEVSVRSARKVWWLCRESRCEHAHAWQASPSSRTRSRGAGCPFCSGRQVCPCTSLAGRMPEIAATWHPTRNGALKPTDVPPYTALHKVWWLCDKGPPEQPHEWVAKVQDRALGRTPCPFCKAYPVPVWTALNVERVPS